MQFKTISDQKRLVRGEHWAMTRRILRERDKVHHANWRVMILAGPEPQEEIDTIRSLLSKAHILAIDMVQENVEKAIAAGADDVACIDLHDWDIFESKTSYYGSLVRPPKFFTTLPDSVFPAKRMGPGHPAAYPPKFDAICLDFTGPASDALKKTIATYLTLLSTRGAMMVTFCYGRDVTEVFESKYDPNGWHGSPLVPDKIRQRISYVLGEQKTGHVRSIMQYRGGQMPMVSFVLQKLSSQKVDQSFVAVEETDYEDMVVDDWPAIYSCPQERVEHIRRKRAAQKAVATRKAKASSAAFSGELPLMMKREVDNDA